MSKSYGENLVLDGISLNIASGSILGYVGPNGAGKTTTIKIMTGVLTDFEGEVNIHGHSMPREKYQISRHLGYMPQNVAFHDWRTVEQALGVFGRLSGLAGDSLQKRIDETLELVMLTEHRRKQVKELSGGMIQKLGLAQAILHQSKLLVLDEPFVGLDPPSRVQFKDIITQLNQQGVTVLFSSHVLSDVEDLAHSIAVLNKGNVVYSGTVDALRAQVATDYKIKFGISRDTKKWQNQPLPEGVDRIEPTQDDQLIVTFINEYDPYEITQRTIEFLLMAGCWIHSVTPVSPSLEELIYHYLEEDNQT